MVEQDIVALCILETLASFQAKQLARAKTPRCFTRLLPPLHPTLFSPKTKKAPTLAG